jgi:hypothetical protein
VAQKDSRKEERTKYPGIYARSDGAYLVRFKERGRSRKRVFRTMALAREFKGQIDGGGSGGRRAAKPSTRIRRLGLRATEAGRHGALTREPVSSTGAALTAT